MPVEKETPLVVQKEKSFTRKQKIQSAVPILRVCLLLLAVSERDTLPKLGAPSELE